MNGKITAIRSIAMWDQMLSKLLLILNPKDFDEVKENFYVLTHAKFMQEQKRGTKGSLCSWE